MLIRTNEFARYASVIRKAIESLDSDLQALTIDSGAEQYTAPLKSLELALQIQQIRLLKELQSAN